jgi:Transcription factor WhiB
MKLDRFARALLDLAAAGERTHCSDHASHHLWLSEDEHERAVAVMLCRHCPVEMVCRETAELRKETWGVWGSKDFSRRPGKKGTP